MLKSFILESILSLILIKISLLFSLFNGQDSGLCWAKTPNNIIVDALELLLNFQLIQTITDKIINEDTKEQKCTSYAGKLV